METIPNPCIVHRVPKGYAISSQYLDHIWPISTGLVREDLPLMSRLSVRKVSGFSKLLWRYIC